MSQKKLVDKEALIQFSKELEELYEMSSESAVRLKIIGLQVFYNEKILETAKVNFNEIKRALYLKMKNCTDSEKSKLYYEMYQSLKNTE